MSKIISGRIKPLMGMRNTGKWTSISDTTITQNGKSKITLRSWQNEALDVAKNNKKPHMFVNCPTGSGKSKAGLAIFSELEKDTYRLVIISAPQKEIGKGFLISSGDSQEILGHVWMINPANQLCENSYKNEDGNIERLREVLKSPRLKDLNERIVICCHATLALLFAKLTPYEKEKYFKDILLCVDESHHSFSQDDVGNGLGKTVKYFLKHQSRNLSLLMMTATPFRGDRGSLIPEKYLDQFSRYDLDYGRHFEENCNGLEFTYNALLHKHGTCYGPVIKELMDIHLNRGDRILVQIPPSNMRSVSNGKINDLKLIYDSIGEDQRVDSNGIMAIKRKDRDVRILDLINEKDRPQRLDYLRNNPLDIDVVVGISIIKEGFDWPPANAGILIGKKNSLTAQIQIMGRMFRDFENKGKNRGKRPVVITQLFPYIDYEKLDEDQARDQINDFAKIVYSALAMELVINPIHIDLPIKTDEKGEPKPRQSVRNFLLETLTETQCVELMGGILDDYRDWKANAEDDIGTDEIRQKISEIVSAKLTEFGITENHDEIAEYYYKFFQRSSKFQLLPMEGIDISNIDIDLMADINDPIESIIMGMSNGLCDAKSIKDFQALMKPVGSVTGVCNEVEEFVNSHGGRWPSPSSDNADEAKLGNFVTVFRSFFNKKYKHNYVFTQQHIDKIINITGWNPIMYGSEEEWLIKYNQYKNEIDNGVYPPIKTAAGQWFTDQRKLHNHGGKLSKFKIFKLEELNNWWWSFDDLWIKKYNTTPIDKIWANNQKIKYKNGKLENWKIGKLESLDGWAWNIKLDNISNNIKLIIKWSNESGDVPSIYSKNKYEKKLGMKVESFIRSEKEGRITKANKDALLRVCPYIFNRRKNKILSIINKAKEVIQFYKLYKKIPNKRSADEYEKKLGHFYTQRKSSKRGTADGNITEEENNIFSILPDWPK